MQSNGGRAETEIHRQRNSIDRSATESKSKSSPMTFSKLKPVILFLLGITVFCTVAICLLAAQEARTAQSIIEQKIQESHLFPHVETPTSDFKFRSLTNANSNSNPDATSSLGFFNPRRLQEDTQEDTPFETGSFSDCEPHMKTSRSTNSTFTLTTDTSNGKPHPESGITVISCRTIHYRAPLMEIEKGGHKVAVGVLSGAGGKGPLHRDSIRSTWARDRKGVYFIVSGPWNDIREEYDKYRDLIWIEEDEVYEGEESVLPFKTEIFIAILQKYSLPGKAGFEYLFKTDDDSFVDIEKLEKFVGGKKYDYWGCCTTENFKPLRSPTRKWRVTFEMYPEEYYPLYCQGAGFALSRKFVECASHHLAKFRYNPFEDVSVGLLAERCGIKPETDFVRIKQYRTEEAGEKKQMKNVEKKEIFFLPKATMKNKILQHRVKTHYDMYAHYKCVKEGC